ncbi:unnamed protein product [[Candida] boidinii]|uniref:Unnamed protein product n=1 Tax=Candida boidinii TaxID=5477 RepID=A0ACB5U1J8_CANBO|nr:unnamed protein product [[Candida] boidinii]
MSDKVQDLLSKASQSLNSNNLSDSKSTIKEAIQLCSNEKIDDNLSAKCHLLLGDILLKENNHNDAIESFKKAAELDEKDGVEDTKEIKQRLNSLLNTVTNDMQKEVESNPNSGSNEKSISDMILNQVMSSSGGNSAKLAMLGALLKGGSSSSSSGGLSQFSSLVNLLGKNGVSGNSGSGSSGFDVSKLVSMW